jgi:hypothetical protein
VIALVSCSGPKLSHAAPARSLYASPLFQRASAYAARHFERWFILSGKYGLVEPEAIIAPYDVDVTHFTAAQRRSWARQIAEQIAERELPGPFVALAGKRYREPLEPHISLRPHPTNGLTIGRALAWYSRNP